MKQYVTFEQAKEVFPLRIDADRHYYKDEKILFQGNYRNRYRFPAPSIGELIAWIKHECGDVLKIEAGWRLQSQWCVWLRHTKDISICVQTELIDALVELAIKIAESNS